MRLLFALVGLVVAACSAPVAEVADQPPATLTSEQAGYRWDILTEHAAFPGSYNFPVHVLPDGRFLALHPDGVWESRGGATWTKAELPPSGMNSAYLHYVQHGDAIYALGKHHGQGYSVNVDPVVQRTTDFRTWEQLGTSDTLPKKFFYGAASFKGWIWMVGGRTGVLESPGIWRSRDGMSWERAPGSAPFGARERPQVVVFRDKLWIIGGGGHGAVWSSPDGETWWQEARALGDPEPFGYTAVVFDDRLWLIGANRSGGFSREMLVSNDGRDWTPVAAPWSPRGAVAAWTDGRALYVTGGKYSRTRANGELEFIYSNDVWKMTRSEP